MIAILLEENGFEVVNDTKFGTTDIIRRAIFNDEIDIYPEYTGNGGFFFSGTDSLLRRNADSAYRTVAALDLAENEIVRLEPAPANNTWAIAVRSDLAESANLVTLEDFARYIGEGGEIKLAGSEEFVTRVDALPSFEEAYGTDGALAALGLVIMPDSLGVQPVYEPAPIVRRTVLDAFPEIETILAPVFRTLTLETLQGLNARIAVEGRPAESVAREYLENNGFID